MGKKDKKVDASKKEAKKARQAQKQQKALQKAKKKDIQESGEDIEKIIADFTAKEAAKTAVTVTPLPGPPSRRANFSLTALPNGDLVMFGGEYYDGERVEVYSDVIRWQVEKNEWKAIESLNTPPPRCSHQAVYYQEKVYLFGGEYATTDQFYHFKDLWCLDLKTNVWKEIHATGDCPSGRSGHRMVVWRNYLVLFGGFYEAMREVRWFNDLFFFSFQEERWTQLPVRPSAPIPRPRSGVQMCVHTAEDVLYIMGGYSKEKVSGSGGGSGGAGGGGGKEGRVHEDMWMIALKPALPAVRGGGGGAGGGLDVSKLSWQKVSRKGDYPTARSGAVMTVFKNKALSFGGVVDEEQPGHTLLSTFYNDLRAFDLDRRRWYLLGLRTQNNNKKGSGGGGGGKKKVSLSATSGEVEQEEEEGSSDEEEEEEERGEGGAGGGGGSGPTGPLFGYIDENGQVVYIPYDDLVDEEEQQEEGQVVEGKGSTPPPAATLDATTPPPPPEVKVEKEVKKEEAEEVLPALQKMSLTATIPPPPAAATTAPPPTTTWQTYLCDRKEPCPRINPALLVRGQTLIVYGGVTEVGEVEVTLDDCWALDLNKRESWKKILPGTMHEMVWKGVDDDDESSRRTGDRGDDSGSDDSDDDDSDDDDDDDEDDSEEEEEESRPSKSKKSAASSSSKHNKRREGGGGGGGGSGGGGLRAEMEALRREYSLTEDGSTPLPGEALRAFYARTADYWAGEVVKQWQAQSEQTQSREVLSEKEVKKQAFILSESRYNSLLPVLARLTDLAQQQEELEQEEEPRKGKGSKGSSGSGKGRR
eukprot:scaffold402_cov166-Ochromonas_danica.AAC.1